MRQTKLQGDFFSSVSAANAGKLQCMSKIDVPETV
jgi:hypothetical protein